MRGHVAPAYCTATLSPPLVMAVYIGTAGSNPNFSVSGVFTSLTIISLVSSPLVHLFQTVPGLGAAYGCLQRIQGFLELSERKESRMLCTQSSNGYGDKSTPEHQLRGTASQNVLSLRNVSLGWKAESPILSYINVDVKRGSRVAIIGPTGCGKSLFLKGLLGEAQQVSGQLIVGPSTTFAYCSQTPWLENVPALENLTQYGPDSNCQQLLEKLVRDCLLDDIVRNQSFKDGPVGSGGVMLSGGQRQRLVRITTSLFNYPQ